MTAIQSYQLNHHDWQCLKQCWQYTCHQLDLNTEQTEIQQQYTTLRDCYSQPHRAYLAILGSTAQRFAQYE